MAEPSRYTPEQLSILLRIAAGKLGRDPVKLQEELQNGRLDGLLLSGAALLEESCRALVEQLEIPVVVFQSGAQWALSQRGWAGAHSQTPARRR